VIDGSASSDHSGEEQTNMAHILVVDDEEQIRLMLQQLLERVGHQVTAVANGDEAVKTYRENPVDVIITDLIMPGKEGIETITELKREFPDVKIIAMSGGGRVGPKNYLSLAEKLGAHRTFAKPFDHKKMIEAIDEIVQEEQENP